ncbi:MAG TPA: thiamine phosphate synthase [Rhizomicrobium sp.]|nr:thiamine phosphate synthase [Rhizomicrobium sp.]
MTDKLARVKLARAAAALNPHSGLPALVLMTDDERLADPVAAARALPRGSMVVVRARQGSHRAKLASELRAVTRRRGTRLLIANDAELAARIGADGLHLSEANARQAAHWRARHPHWIITVTAHSLAACHVPYADALFVAPVFATRSHPGGRHLGAMQMRIIARQVSRPVYALGGIDAVSAMQLAGAKLAGFAAVGALAI